MYPVAVQHRFPLLLLSTMRGSRRLLLQRSRAVLDGPPTSRLRDLEHRWAEVAAAKPATATAQAAQLLTETVSALEKAPVAALATPPGNSPKTEAAASPSPAPALSLLSSREGTELVWGALRRQRVRWQDALRLLPFQVATLTPVQGHYLKTHAAKAPWKASAYAVAAWDTHDDAALVRQYHAMKKATNVVAFARLVSAALRERPSLPGGLLPMPYGVLLHGYALGRDTVPAAQVALAMSKHVTLLGRAALSREAAERLVLSHAALQGRVGQWQAALEAVRGSREVRLSSRERLERYVSALDAGVAEVSAATPPLVTSASVPDMRHSSEHLRVAPGQVGDEWPPEVRTFLAQSLQAQTYREAHLVLQRVPRCTTAVDEGFLAMAAAMLQCCARRMYAGTLTRRLTAFAGRGDWAMGIALACAAQCYDVAAPLLHRAAFTGELPPDLRQYLATVAALERQAAQQQTHHVSPSPPLSESEAAALSYPAALAHALTTTSSAARRTLLRFSPHAAAPGRLRFFLLAASDAAAEVEGGADIHVECCTFHSRPVSRLVCAAADRRNQQYFFRVIPASTRAHHFERSPLTNVPMEPSAGHTNDAAVSEGEGELEAAAPSPPLSAAAAAARTRVQDWMQGAPVATPQDCTRLLTDLAAHLRATHTLEVDVLATRSRRPRLTEIVFLRCVAAISAAGIVQLPPTERFHWPLAVFRTAALLRVPLDASRVSAAARALPSVHVDRARLALPVILGAHTLLGDWQAGLRLCTRLLRKEGEGGLALHPGARQSHAHKFTAPPPSLLDAMAQVGYAVPMAAAALRHWGSLSAASRGGTAPTCALPVLLRELRQQRDARQLCAELRDARARDRHGGARDPVEGLFRRRMLVGAAFSLLDSEPTLRRVLQAAGAERAHAADLDAHGLQRLLRVLPHDDVARVLAAEAVEGRCAHEHWICDELGRPGVAVATVTRLVRLQPYSPTLSALRGYHEAAAQQEALACLRALVRLAEGLAECPYQEILLLSIIRLLRAFLADDALLSACATPSLLPSTAADVAASGSAPRPQSALSLAFRLFNRMQEVPRLSVPLRHARQVARRAVSPPPLQEDASEAPTTAAPRAGPCAVWAVLAALHAASSRAVQLPVPAAFTSHLLSRIVGTCDAVDWPAALLVFRQLRRPTLQERASLVRALRRSGAAAVPALLSQRLFVRGVPEQVVVWADPAGGESRWLLSLSLLERAQVAVETPQSGAVADATATPARLDDTATLLAPEVVAIVRRWNGVEALRCAKLMRRLGLLVMPHDVGGDDTLAGARVAEMSEARARAQTAALLQLLKARVDKASPPAAETPMLAEAHPPHEPGSDHRAPWK